MSAFPNIPGLESLLVVHLPDTVELWRDPDATPQSPTANRDAFGLQVKTNVPNQAPTGARKVGECKGQLAPSSLVRGRPVMNGNQVVAISPWVISLPVSKVESWALGKGDVLKTQGRSFQIVDPTGTDSTSPLRLVWCEEAH